MVVVIVEVDVVALMDEVVELVLISSRVVVDDVDVVVTLMLVVDVDMLVVVLVIPGHGFVQGPPQSIPSSPWF